MSNHRCASARRRCVVTSPPARRGSRSSRPATTPRRRPSRRSRRRRPAPWRPPTTICLVQPCASLDDRRGPRVCRRRSNCDAPRTPAGRPAWRRLRGHRLAGRQPRLRRLPGRRPRLGGRTGAHHVLARDAVRTGRCPAALTDEYNASQDRVVVELQNQNGYEELIDKYFQSSQEDRPARHPAARVHAPADGRRQHRGHVDQRASRPSGYDISPFLPRAMFAYQTGGVQWAMPFNISTRSSTTTGTCSRRPASTDDPPITLDELREYSQADRRLGRGDLRHRPRLGVNSAGPGSSSSGWPAPGCPTPTTTTAARRGRRRCCSTRRSGDMLTFAQDLVADELAVVRGRGPAGHRRAVALGRSADPAAMTIATSGGLGAVLNFAEGGAIAGSRPTTSALARCRAERDAERDVGGAALYIVERQGRRRGCGGVGLHQVPRQRRGPVAVGRRQRLLAGPRRRHRDRAAGDDLRRRPTLPRRLRPGQLPADDFSAVGPVLGPMRQVRQVTARMMADIFGGGDVADALAAAADQADLLIVDYNSRNYHPVPRPPPPPLSPGERVQLRTEIPWKSGNGPPFTTDGC